jgi:hypothetical protein
MQAYIVKMLAGANMKTGVAKHTVLNLLRDLGCAAAKYHHLHVRGLRLRNLQCDEI